MTFHMDFGARQRSRKGRRATVMPLWLVVALVASLLVACCLVTLIGVLTLMAAAGSIVIGSVLALAFLAVVNTMTPVAFLVLAARCVGVALVARVIPRAFEVLILCEAAFYLFYRFRSRRWRQVRAYGPRISKEERWMHFQRVLDTSPDMEAFLRGWFINQPPLAAIRRENVVEWLAWAFFSESVDVMSPEELSEIDSMISAIHKQHGVAFGLGYNPDVTSIRLSLDRHWRLHRPLVYYLVIYAMDYVSRLMLRGMGFRRYKVGGGNPNFYWYRPAPRRGSPGKGLLTVVGAALWRIIAVKSWLRRVLSSRWVRILPPPDVRSESDSDGDTRATTGRGVGANGSGSDSDSDYAGAAGGYRRRATTGSGFRLDDEGDDDEPEGGGAGSTKGWPGAAGAQHGKDSGVVLFFHGIGIGVTAYLPLIWGLLKLRQATCVVEVPNISSRLVNQITTSAQVVGAVGTMLHTHGHDKVTLVGHSFGSIHAAWVIKAMPDAVLGTVLLDPVCLLLAEPDVCYNFMYRVPSSFSELSTFVMASTELTISHSIGRHFWWHQNILWFEQFPHKGTRTSVLLSGQDSIVPSDKVRAYLEHRGVSTLYYPHLTHGGFMANGDIRWKVIQTVAKQHGCENDLAHSLGDAALFWMSDDWEPHASSS